MLKQIIDSGRLHSIGCPKMKKQTIDINKKYRTTSGHRVRIICVDRKSYQNNSIIGLVETDENTDHESIVTWYKNGKHNTNAQYDLVEVSPFDDFNIDDKVLVKDCYDYEWKKRYFAGIDEDTGEPLAFADGLTSWITDQVIAWEECVKYDASKEYMVKK